MFGGDSVMMWGCMMWESAGYLCKIGDADLYGQIPEGELHTCLEYYNKSHRDILFQHDYDLSKSAKRHRGGSKMMESSSCHGLHSLQILIPLNTCGIIGQEC